MNEIPVSVFSIFAVIDLIIIAYALYGLDFKQETKIDKILSAVISSAFSFILANSILNGNVVQTYATAAGYNYIPVQSLPLNYIFLGFGMLMAILSVLFIIKIIGEHLEQMENDTAMGDWK